jgi:citronellol/citronellal dehydrogenase
MIATAAVQNLLGGDEAMSRSRTPAVVADAAFEILGRDPREHTGNTYLDDEVLAEAGITDLSVYAGSEDAELELDLFLEDWGSAATTA